jgi:ABC-type branched-subunit amino acid transport system ATPase component
MILEVEGVRAGYGRLEIRQGVSLSVAPGEVVGIIGPNGAGKSTLLKTIFAYLRPFEGAIRFDGADITGITPDQVMRRGLAYVAQAGGVFADMTVAENLALGGYTLATRAAVRDAMERVYARFPLFRDRSAQRAGSLSGGEQRALSVARTLMTGPRLLVLDEPSAALSPVAIDEIYDTLLGLHAEGIALLIVEQNVEKILEVAQRVVVLDMGRNAFGGTAADLRSSDRIRRLYMGEQHELGEEHA